MVLMEPKECIGCMKCVEVCSFGAVFPRPGGKEVALCDLCQGDPKCVAVCDTRALEWVTKFEVGERDSVVLVRSRPTVPAS